MNKFYPPYYNTLVGDILDIIVNQNKKYYSKLIDNPIFPQRIIDMQIEILKKISIMNIQANGKIILDESVLNQYKQFKEIIDEQDNAEEYKKSLKKDLHDYWNIVISEFEKHLPDAVAYVKESLFGLGTLLTSDETFFKMQPHLIATARETITVITKNLGEMQLLNNLKSMLNKVKILVLVNTIEPTLQSQLEELGMKIILNTDVLQEIIIIDGMLAIVKDRGLPKEIDMFELQKTLHFNDKFVAVYREMLSMMSERNYESN